MSVRGSKLSGGNLLGRARRRRVHCGLGKEQRPVVSSSGPAYKTFNSHPRLEVADRLFLKGEGKTRLCGGPSRGLKRILFLERVRQLASGEQIATTDRRMENMGFIGKREQELPSKCRHPYFQAKKVRSPS